ncbi:uncharacterized protein I206_105808 [Kwoniella pini CBS 10737]|uniref:Uncharacterized protein n=1 Tax=Kwoniella pini CBS 10737 TaxID=1296096 RepID=A0A1B9I0F7_9TREE|nr:uncharacterized protein I206_04628 [Kwoniella pini CBS 10737]OCF48941.1 hypothetical protein I206_04628 [Kwoniella pini CBS 10737]
MPRHILQPLPKAFKPSSSNSKIHRNDERMWDNLDRVQVLGERDGHRGCVNALSWSDDGKTLLSGSDDQRICIWQPDPHPSSSYSPHPLKLADTISTGHRANIFSAKFLPNTSTPTIVSCAGDKDVRVFEVERLVRNTSSGELIGARGDGVTILRCHKDRTKRIATENSPYLFLTVSEDGTVRQHDLRRPHTCRSQCPEPLFYAPKGVDLYSLSVSTVTPHIFAVAGRTDTAYICDRRMLPRQTPSWGPHTRSSGQVHCVRKLGLPNDEWEKVSPNNGNRMFGEERHITCVKMSPEHADEVAVAFAKHSTSLFSIYDSPPSTSMRTTSPVILPSNEKTDKSRSSSPRPVKLKDGKTPSPASSSPAPFIPADDELPRPTPKSKTDIVKDESGDLEEDARSSPSLGKRRQSDRESILAESSISANRPRKISDLITHDVLDEIESGSRTNRSTTIDAQPGHYPTSAENKCSDNVQRVGPPTPPAAYTREDFLRDEENGDGEHERSDEEEDEPSLSDMEDLALDILDQNGMLEDIMSEEEDEEDDLDEFDDEDEDMEDDDGGDGDEYFLDPDVGILGYGGSNASNLDAKAFDDVDIIYPRRSYKGARNVETVKDCNFLGVRADKICSGSDDGNFFVWDKETGKLEGIWEGDGSVVNVMEQHPTLPLIAVSGIDNTVKMFAPTQTPMNPSFSRKHLSETIVERNTRVPRFLSGGSFDRATLLQFFASRGITVRSQAHDDDVLNGDDGDGVEGCATQ